jgi:hypothetical protein
VLVELRRDAITVPAAAVQRGPDGIYAWVVMPGDVVQVRPIQSGPTTGDDTIITSGLSEGDRVVVNGQYKLQRNSKVTVNGSPAPATPTIARGGTPTLARDDTQSAQKPYLSVCPYYPSQAICRQIAPTTTGGAPANGMPRSDNGRR